MKNVGIILTLVAVVSIIVSIVGGIRSNYQYNKEIESYWELADKASTVVAKSQNIDLFVAALEKSGLQGEYNAVWLKTPDNSFDMNLAALKTLQQRLHEIQGMNVSSFEYQTAMQQITDNEQGGASDMLSVFEGVWYKENYPFLWNWIAWVQIIVTILIGWAGISIWADEY